MSETLEHILAGGGTPVPAAPPQPAPSPEPEPAPAAEPAPEPDTEPEALTKDGDIRTVPLSALEGERAQRKDWKEKAVRAETERDELRRQLEEAKRTPRPEPQQPQRQINPAEDPAGYDAQVRHAMLNERLNISELMARKEVGAEKVEAAIADFKVAAEQDPSLYSKLYSQPDPYGWAIKHVETIRLQREIGDDPASYEARLRAKWEAEREEEPAPRPVSPAAGMAPSLAKVRSAAPRGAPAYNGPLSLDDILSIRK